MMPIIDRLAGQFAGRVKVGKVDIAEDPQTAERFAIQSVPRVYFFHQGEPVHQLYGYASEPELVKAVQRVLRG